MASMENQEFWWGTQNGLDLNGALLLRGSRCAIMKLCILNREVVKRRVMSDTVLEKKCAKIKA